MNEQSYFEVSLDLNKELVKNPASTFYARVSGDSMNGARIYDGDILVIDKSLEPETGDIAVCCLDGEFTLKFIELHQDHILLIPANDLYPTIKVEGNNSMGDDFTIWGIVTNVIHKTSR